MLWNTNLKKVDPLQAFLIQALRIFYGTFHDIKSGLPSLRAMSLVYTTLLSIVPMFALIMVVLSQVHDTQDLLQTLHEYLLLITPNQADALIEQISAFQQNWKVVGLMGLLVLLFFTAPLAYMPEAVLSVVVFLIGVDLIDFEAGARVTGHGFYFLKNEAVLLELALQRPAPRRAPGVGYRTRVSDAGSRRRQLVGKGGYCATFSVRMAMARALAARARSITSTALP